MKLTLLQIAVFIFDKILSTGEGLQYCCVLPDRFFLIDGLLKTVLVYLTTMATPCPSLFNLLVGCYAKLSYKPRFFFFCYTVFDLFEFLVLKQTTTLYSGICTRACRGLRRYLPATLFNGTFASLLAVRLNPLTVFSSAWFWLMQQ